MNEHLTDGHPVDGPVDRSRISTGEAQVDAAVARLAELDDRPLDEHAQVFADIHGELGSVLNGSADVEPSDQ